MVKTNSLAAIASIAFVALSTSAPAQAQQSSMSFFVTSVGPGKGGDLGGLEGADRHCQSLAQAVGAGGKTWRARSKSRTVQYALLKLFSGDGSSSDPTLRPLNLAAFLFVQNRRQRPQTASH
jgi:hypothetical protein